MGWIRVFFSVLFCFFFLSKVSLLLFLYLTLLKHETQTRKLLTEYNHSQRNSSWEGGACLPLRPHPPRPFTRMIFIRLAGVGAQSLRVRTQKKKVSREAEGSQKQHSCLSRMINSIDIMGTFKKRGKKMNSKEKEKDRVLTRKGGWSEPYNSSWWRRKLEVWAQVGDPKDAAPGTERGKRTRGPSGADEQNKFYFQHYRVIIVYSGFSSDGRKLSPFSR